MRKYEMMEKFVEAIKNKATFIGIKVEMENFPMPEIIVNKTANFEKKLDYLSHAYNEDLEHNYSKGVRIIDCQYADNMGNLAVKLGEEHIW